MREPDNPFVLRESEQIEHESSFLNLFGDGALELLKKDYFINKPTIIVSGPGAGKTSLLRIFTPQSLSYIHARRDRQDFRVLYNRLAELDVVRDSEGPTLLGIYLPCSTNYADLEGLAIDRVEKDRLFFSLLNARLLSTALISILSLKGLQPADLKRITISRNLPESSFDLPINGKDLYQYASSMEAGICRKVGSFDFSGDDAFASAAGLDYFFLLSSKNIKLDGKEIVSNVLVMLDDVHVLGKFQRRSLRRKIEQQRVPIPIWVTERKEALEFNELLPGQEDRDFQKIEIEEFFRDRPKKYESFVLSVAKKRISNSPYKEIDFEKSVDDAPENLITDQQFLDVISEIKMRIRKKISDTSAYNAWIKQQETELGSMKERAIGWKSLEIRIERRLSGGQQLLIDSPLEIEDLASAQSSVKTAAEFLLDDEFHFPYYFGLSRLTSLSTFNIQQYLMLGSEFFEQMKSKFIMKRNTSLAPKEQEDLIREMANSYSSGITTRIPYGTYASNLIQAITNMAGVETRRSTAPYPPGITGIGITSQQYRRISDPLEQERKPEYKILEKLLHSCIANNLFLANFDYKQGSKEGDSNVVLYLNRLLCVQFRLPLGYGGWKKTNPRELSRWAGIVMRK